MRSCAHTCNPVQTVDGHRLVDMLVTLPTRVPKCVDVIVTRITRHLHSCIHGSSGNTIDTIAEPSNDQMSIAGRPIWSRPQPHVINKSEPAVNLPSQLIDLITRVVEPTIGRSQSVDGELTKDAYCCHWGVRRAVRAQVGRPGYCTKSVSSRSLASRNTSDLVCILSHSTVSTRQSLPDSVHPLVNS